MKDAQRLKPQLSDYDFERLRAFLVEKAGLHFDEQSRVLYERRLAERLELLQLGRFSDYLDLVEVSASEQDELFEIITTKETYFFRQDYQLRAFVNELLPNLMVDAPDFRRLTVWSAGCSTGEEAYSLAILLSESPLVSDTTVQVVGTDLCASSVEAARRAEYRAGSFRAVAPELMPKYFEKEGATYRVLPKWRRLCHFQRANLLSPIDVRSVGRVDAIFCRNVFIYLEEEARRRVVAQLYERLLPGGYLLLGHTESLLNTESPFEVVHMSSDVAYRRPRERSGTRGGLRG